MAGITLAQAEAQLTDWLAASTAVASNQSYTIKDRTLTRADATAIQDQIVFWNGMVKSLTRGGIRVRGGVPVT